MASAAAVVMVSCNKNQPPVFDDSNAFIAFSSASVSVSENADTVVIPISLASVAGLNGTATFKVYADTTAKGVSPEEGVNYEILSEGGTLKFDSKNRIQYIKVVGKYFPEYTGDLSFRIVLESQTKDISLGTLRECKVVINDIDHPLTPILGEYTATTTGIAYSDPWILTIFKDESDDHKVWLDNVFANPGWAASDTRIYGNVKDDGNGKLLSIDIPLGQKVEYKYGKFDVFVYGCMISGEYIYFKKTGAITATIGTDSSGKTTLDFGDGEYDGFGLYIDQNGTAGYAASHITAVKK